MRDDVVELADEIEKWLRAGRLYSELALSGSQWQQIIAALRRSL